MKILIAGLIVIAICSNFTFNLNAQIIIKNEISISPNHPSDLELTETMEDDIKKIKSNLQITGILTLVDGQKYDYKNRREWVSVDSVRNMLLLLTNYKPIKGLVNINSVTKQPELSFLYCEESEKNDQTVWSCFNNWIEFFIQPEKTENIKVVFDSDGSGSSIYTNVKSNKFRSLIKYDDRSYSDDKQVINKLFPKN